MKDLQAIKLRTEEIFGIEDISIKNRSDEYILARAAYYYAAKKKTNYSLSKIADLVNKDHACVFHAFSKMDEYDLYFKGFKEKRLSLLGINIKPFDVLYKLFSVVDINEVEDVILAVISVISQPKKQKNHTQSSNNQPRSTSRNLPK